MKVVHSHADKLDCIWKELAYSQFLSAILAKKHYGNISFYGTPKLVKQVRDLGIPYTSFDSNVVKKDDSTTWSMPKIKVFESIKEPFLHIDNDTFLFDKIDFQSYHKPFLFSHPDLGIKRHPTRRFSDDLSKLLATKNSYQKNIDDFYHDINRTYTRLLFKLYNKLPDNLIDKFDLNSIPNMNLVYVEDYKTFNQVAGMAIEHYNLNKSYIDKEEYGPCYIEQLVLHQLLRAVNPDYEKYSSKFKHTIFKRLPFYNLDQYNNTAEIENVKFPFRGRLHTRCKCCGKKKKYKLNIKSKEELVPFLDYNFEGFLHSTYMKWYDMFQAHTIHNLRKEIGDNELRKIHQYFRKIYPAFNLPLKSGGEKLYEELTGFSFEEVGSHKNNSYI